MISAWHLVWIIPGCILAGLFLAALLHAGSHFKE